MPFNLEYKRHQMQSLMLFLVAILIILTLNVFIASAAQQNQPIRVRIFTMHHITALQAKDYLSQAQVTDSVVAIPNTSAISVTAAPQQLVFAKSILRLVDSNEQFDIQMLDIEAGSKLPESVKIEAKLDKGFSVGTLLEESENSAAFRVIVDTYKDKTLIISPKGQTEKVVSAIRSAIASEKQKEQGDANVPAKQSLPIDSNNQQIIPPVPPSSVNDVNFAEEPVVIEPNSLEPETSVKVFVNGKAQTEEDKVLADFVSELTDAAVADGENVKPQAVTDQEPIIEEARVETPADVCQPVVQAIVPEAKKSESLPEQLVTQVQEQKTEQPSAEKIQEPIQNEPKQLAAEAEQMQEKLPVEANQSAVKTALADLEKTSTVPEVNIPNGDEILELNLPEKLDIVALIDLVGRHMNLNYLYDETKVTGSVTVKVQGKIRVRELYNLLESVLKFRGFVMSRKGNLVTIAPASEVLDQDPRFVEAGMKPGDVTVTSVFHLKYISTTVAKRLLAEMRLGSNITEIPEIGTLVITEYAFRMQRIEELLNLVDVPGPPKEFKIRILKYTLAESLVPKIKDLAEQLGTIEITIGTSVSEELPAAVRGRSVRTPPRPMPQPQQSESAKTTAGVYIDSDKRTNRVLMIGLESEMAAVNNIIDTLDVPQQDLRTIREYEIQYVDITEILKALKELGVVENVDVMGTGVGKSQIATLVGAPKSATPAGMSQAIESSTAVLDQPQVVPLETTNSLLINATPEQHIQISQIISYVDREPVQTAIPYRIYRLENQEPEALAEVLNNLIEKTVKDKEGKIQQTVKIQEDNIAIVPDKNTFSLIVYASKKNQDWIGNLIQTLDTRRPQVLIDVSLVEVTRNDAFQFDLDMVANAKGLVSENKILANPATAAGIGGNREASFIGGTTKGFYSADKIQALLTLVNTKGYGRVLAQPKVLVNDNEEGTINTTSQRYVSEETQSYPGTTTGSTPIPVTTKSWKSYDAKIELKITPQISEGELLRLEVDMTREDFGTKEATDAPPPKTTSHVTTVVTVPDGSTIILGGLNKLNQTKTGSKTPFLGDIPIAGGLFRNIDNSNDERRLYVFVKANISRPDAMSSLKQLKEISRKNQIEFEKMEDKFQKHEDFPWIKPEPVEPLKVLGQEPNEPVTDLSEDK